MKRIIRLLMLTTCILATFVNANCDGGDVPQSPDKKITIKVDDMGKFRIYYDTQPVLTIDKIGYDNSKAATKLNYVATKKDKYTMVMGKQLHCSNIANEYNAYLGDNVRLIFRIYNNGIAFRYIFNDASKYTSIPQESTAYEIKEGTKRWMMQWCESYEGFFPYSESATQKPVPSFSGIFASKDGYNCRWAYPALLQPTDSVFVLLSESDVRAYNSASCLWNDHQIDRFEVRADINETRIQGGYTTPWRVAIIGSLANIVESTLITDLAEPSKLEDVSWIKPGVVSWIYWAYNHGSNDYNIIKKYIDMAVELHLPYMLIDAEWDEMKDGKNIEDAVAYALQKGVKPLIWYNSSIGWVDGAPTPKYRLNKPDDREKEFAWLEKIGVAGVKIDFFSGDNQKNMSYCIDLLESAAKHHLLVNFHGATIPRGWQRTYPNLLSTEGVYGAEWYNNVPTFTEKAACHNATLPFTRNVVGSMDYTPCAFSDSQYPHSTTNAHELALTVLYESGLQHIADSPESLLSQPKEIKSFFSNLPVAWDETRLISGYPGEYVIMARRKGDTWYIAGINGTNDVKSINVNLSFIDKFSTIQAFFDNVDGTGWTTPNLNYLPASFAMAPRGGFVVIVTQK